MNKVMLMGNLTRDPEMKMSQSDMAITRYGIAVRRQFGRTEEKDTDFFNVVAFGKAGEFAEKFFNKGQKVVIVGRLQQNQWTDKEGIKQITIEVVVEEQHFAESKAKNEQGETKVENKKQINITMEEDDDLPF